MADFVFADRYAEAGLAPTAQVITARQASAERILEEANSAQILDLASAYYSRPELDLKWFRDELGKEDSTFSLINNERETRVLAAAILGEMVAAGRPVAILCILTGNVVGHRPPAEAEWLLHDAKKAMAQVSVEERTPKVVDTKIAGTTNPKLNDEIAALALNDLVTLQTLLNHVRAEATSSVRAVSAQASKALAEIGRQLNLQREEGQILWWLIGGHSRNLERPFASWGPLQVALIGALDLASLTTVSRLGPVAAPALLDRVIRLAAPPQAAGAQSLANAVDTLDREEIAKLPLLADKVPDFLSPVMSALNLAKSVGVGAWHARFQENTGLGADIVCEPEALAVQLYREHLLAQLL